MSADNSPTYYFTDIDFNSSFFIDLLTAPLRQTQSTALYLLKNSVDTTTPAEFYNYR
jgi:hypothetical protein